MSNPEERDRISDKGNIAYSLLELTVNNHPGVMSHICGLFSRRAFNVEKILCLPLEKGERSRIWLTVCEDHRLEQVIKQVMKLEDVLECRSHGMEPDLFLRLEEIPASSQPAPRPGSSKEYS